MAFNRVGSKINLVLDDCKNTDGNITATHNTPTPRRYEVGARTMFNNITNH